MQYIPVWPAPTCGRVDPQLHERGLCRQGLIWAHAQYLPDGLLHELQRLLLLLCHCCYHSNASTHPLLGCCTCSKKHWWHMRRHCCWHDSWGLRRGSRSCDSRGAGHGSSLLGLHGCLDLKWHKDSTQRGQAHAPHQQGEMKGYKGAVRG